MWLRVLLCVVAVGAFSPGCGPLLQSSRTLVIEPLEYCQPLDSLSEHFRNRRLADDAWDHVWQVNPDHTYSPDYVRGFKEGYADYLYAGGTGAPPPLPPRPYWKAKYDTPQGHQAIEEWFAGFRHGAAEAQQSGYRQFVVVPTSSPGPVSGQVNPAISGPPRDTLAARAQTSPQTRVVPAGLKSWPEMTAAPGP